MSETAIIDGTSNIDLSIFSYSSLKPNPAGGAVINLYNKNTKEPLVIASPLMGSWGAQEGKDQAGKLTGKYTLSLQFTKGDYATEEQYKFLENLKKIEHKIKEDALTHSLEWFGKQISSMEVIDEKFTPMLKQPKIKGTQQFDMDAMPNFPIKLPCWKDVWQTSVFDEDYNPLYIKGKSPPDVTPLSFLTRLGKAPIQVITLFQSAGCWLVNGKISITWNLKQVIVRKPKTPSITDDLCVLQIKSSDKQLLQSQEQPEVLPAEDATMSAMVNDSDGEEEYHLPPPPPETQPQPTVVVSKPEVASVEEKTSVPEEPATKKKILKKKTST
jgi:hypothetical protein